MVFCWSHWTARSPSLGEVDNAGRPSRCEMKTLESSRLYPRLQLRHACVSGLISDVSCAKYLLLVTSRGHVRRERLSNYSALSCSRQIVRRRNLLFLFFFFGEIENRGSELSLPTLKLPTWYSFPQHPPKGNGMPTHALRPNLQQERDPVISGQAPTRSVPGKGCGSPGICLRFA